MFLKSLIVGELETNCYLIADETAKTAAVIDPGANSREIIKLLNPLQFKLSYIINTHAHIDHTGANKDLKNQTQAKILIHQLDAPRLTQPIENLSSFLGLISDSPPADKTLKEGDIVTLGAISLKVIHTPGHTPGSICLLEETQKIIFTGDTLFAAGLGRTDFPGGSFEQLVNSIKEKLLTLPEDLKILPGHGPQSTIGTEKRTNPFLTP